MQAFTLLELLLSLLLVMILSLVIIPCFKHEIAKTQLQTQVAHYWFALNFARAKAIGLQKKVSICPSHDGKVCSQDFSQGLLICTGQITNQKIDCSILRFASGMENITVDYHAFPTSASIHFNPSGLLDSQNGHLCFTQMLTHEKKELIINKAGHIRAYP